MVSRRLLLFGLLLLFLGSAYALNYWIEPDNSGNPSKVWVKVPSIPANGTATIYMKKEAGYQPNGDGVFEFFDDFESGTIDTSKWTSYGSVSVESVSDDMYGSYALLVSETSGEVGVLSTDTFDLTSQNYVIEAQYKESTSNDSWTGIHLTTDATTAGHVRNCEAYPYTSGEWEVEGAVISGGTTYCWDFENGTWGTECRYHDDVPDTWPYNKVVRIYILNGQAKFRWERTDGTLLEETTYHSFDTGTFHLFLGQHWNGGCDDFYVYWVRVRKYAPSEPTVTVTDMGDHYEITIQNNTSTDLTDFQISIPASELGVTSTTESIHFSDILNGISVSVTHTPTAVEDLALDPENGINEVNVTYRYSIDTYGVEITEVHTPDKNYLAGDDIQYRYGGSPTFTGDGLVCHGYPDYVLTSSIAYPSDENMSLYVDFTISPDMNVDTTKYATVFADKYSEFGVRIHYGYVEVIATPIYAGYYKVRAVPGKRYRFLLVNGPDGFKVYEINDDGYSLVFARDERGSGFAHEVTILCANSDNDTDATRYFAGTVHQITLWNLPLSESDVNNFVHMMDYPTPTWHSHLIYAYQDGNTFKIKQAAPYSVVFTHVYDSVGDYNTCVYAEGVDSTGQEYNDMACDVVHIDQYPQGVNFDWAPKIPFPTENVQFTGTATDNGTLTYSFSTSDHAFYTGDKDYTFTQTTYQTGIVTFTNTLEKTIIIKSITAYAYDNNPTFTIKCGGRVKFQQVISSTTTFSDLNILCRAGESIEITGEGRQVSNGNILNDIMVYDVAATGYLPFVALTAEVYDQTLDGNPATARFWEVGTYTVTMTVTDDVGLSKSVSKSVAVYSIPTFVMSPNPTVEMDPVTFTHYVDSRLTYTCTIYSPDGNVVGDCNATYYPPPVTGALRRTDNITVEYRLSDDQNNTRDYNATGALTVDQLVVGECNTTISTLLIEANILNEITREQVTDPFTVGIDLRYWSNNNEFRKHFGVVKNNITEFNLCMYPSYATLHLDGRIDYSSTNYPLRSYLYSNALISALPQQLDLYTLALTSGQYYTVYVAYLGKYVDGARISVLRYYPDLGAYLTVAQGETDYEGKHVFFLRPADAWYKFVVTYGDTTQEFGPTTITGTTTVLTLNSDGAGQFDTILSTVQVDCQYVDETNALKCTYTDPTGKVVSAKLTVLRETLLSSTEYNSIEISGPSGSFVVTLDPDYSYYYYLYVKVGNEWYQAKSGYLPLSSDIGPYGIEGPVLAMIVTLAVAAVGYFAPLAAVVFAVIGIVISVGLRLISVGIGAIVGLLAAGVIAVLRRGK